MAQPGQPVTGARLGSREWVGKATAVVERAANGDLEARLLGSASAPEDLARMALAVNNLLDRTDTFVREAGASLEHASHGKFFRRVLERGLLGSFRHGAALINQATEKMAHQATILGESESQRQALAESLERAIRESAKMAGAAVQEVRKPTPSSPASTKHRRASWAWSS